MLEEFYAKRDQFLRRWSAPRDLNHLHDITRDQINHNIQILSDGKNRLVGMDCSLVRCQYNTYMSGSLQSMIAQRAGTHCETEYGYSGCIAIRLAEKKTFNSLDVFQDSLIHAAGGNYSTYGTVFNQQGRYRYELETTNKVQWKHQEPFEVYIYNVKFFIQDFPSLAEHEVMLKLEDREWQRTYNRYFIDPHQQQRDREYGIFLETYQEVYGNG